MSGEGGGGLGVSHVLCTPILWSIVLPPPPSPLTAEDENRRIYLEIVALGGEPTPPRVREMWQRDLYLLDRMRGVLKYGQHQGLGMRQKH